ncbi:MAG TPA: NUDIX hydrolase [Candidatus Eremiobacteraceae bacterium]
MTEGKGPVEPRPWTTRSVETLASNPYFALLLQHVTVNDGTDRQYYTIQFPSPAVGIVARRGNDVLLVRQYRFIVDEFVWAIPSGGTAPGELLADAALRELEEETGYRARSIEPLMHCWASYGCSDQRYEIFLAPEVEHTGNQHDANEVLEVRWFSREELTDLILNNGVVDNLSLSPLLFILFRDGLKAGRVR